MYLAKNSIRECGYEGLGNRCRKGKGAERKWGEEALARVSDDGQRGALDQVRRNRVGNFQKKDIDDPARFAVTSDPNMSNEL
jgi:hypothetical protein